MIWFNRYERKENFAEDIIEAYQLKVCRQVGIYPVLTHKLVMLNMIPLKKTLSLILPRKTNIEHPP